MPLTLEKIQQEVLKRLEKLRETGRFSEEVADLLLNIKLYDRTIARNPNEHNTYFLKANAFITFSEVIEDVFFYEPALLALNKANELSPQNPQYLVDRAKLHVAMLNPDLAKKDLEVLLSFPKDKDLLVAFYVDSTIEEIRKSLSSISVTVEDKPIGMVARAAEESVNIVHAEAAMAPIPATISHSPRVKQLLIDVEFYDNFNSASECNMRAKTLMELADEMKDCSYLPTALVAADRAIELSPDDSMYVADRARLHMKMEHYDLVKKDLDVVRSLPKQKDPIFARYVENITKDLTSVMSTRVSVASFSSSPLVTMSLLANSGKADRLPQKLVADEGDLEDAPGSILNSRNSAP